MWYIVENSNQIREFAMFKKQAKSAIPEIEPVTFQDVMVILNKKQSTIYWYIATGRIKRYENHLGHAIFDRKQVQNLLRVKRN